MGGDRSVVALVAANAAALAVAWFTGMALRELMLVYVIQSIIIGVTSAIRIVKLERFDPSGVRVNRRALEETPAAKRQLALFFAFHYGMFHLGYLFFVVAGADDEFGPIGPYLLCALVFAVNHGYSLAHNLKRDAGGRPKIGTIMILPYARVVPMHATILIGGAFMEGMDGFVLFGVLKTVADVAMHLVEHRVLHKAGEQG